MKILTSAILFYQLIDDDKQCHDGCAGVAAVGSLTIYSRKEKEVVVGRKEKERKTANAENRCPCSAVVWWWCIKSCNVCAAKGVCVSGSLQS